MNLRISVNRNKNPVPLISLPLAIPYSTMHFLTDQLVFPKSTTNFAYSIIEFKKKYIYLFIYYLFMSSTPSFVLYDAYNNEVDDLP
jgi:hypothetical protein